MSEPTKFDIAAGYEGSAVYQHTSYGPSFAGSNIYFLDTSGACNSNLTSGYFQNNTGIQCFTAQQQFMSTAVPAV